MVSERRCCVPKCERTRKDEVILHSFPNPTKYLKRYREWTQAVGCTVKHLEPNFVFKTRRVCHEHFETKYLTWTRRLSAIAVPTLLLPGSGKARTTITDVTQSTSTGERSSVAEKQDDERSEKGIRSGSEYRSDSPPPVSTRALLERVQAQQRRIAALEVAEKGNEPLVSEYEKSLAEITSLKGQVLKLESTLLESQIRTPLSPSNDPQPELEYWKSYCDMLKEENMQLTLRVNSLETTPASAHQQRINDLEQTVLTLRGLVSKLQADQKSGVSKRVDSRPSSGRSTTEKVRNQIDSYRTEISNLKRTLQEKDLLLERSKEMLKIAAEREDELLKENELLRRRFDEIIEHRGGFLSA